MLNPEYWRWKKIEKGDVIKIRKAIQEQDGTALILIHNRYDLSGVTLCCHGDYLLKVFSDNVNKLVDL